MNRLASLVLWICCIGATLIACQKETKQPDEINDAKAKFPRQITFGDIAGEYVSVWSMEYDTLNRRINVYSDDTTTTNPYDKLIKSYQFNEDGFLIKFIDRYGIVNDTSIIARDANNQILYITNRDAFIRTPDTSFYTYESQGTSLNISAKRHNIFSAGAEGPFRDVYSYSNLQLRSLIAEPDSFRYIYEYTGDMLTSVGYNHENGDLNLSCTYATLQPDEPRDYLLEHVLGKDYYVQDIRNMYFFFWFKEFSFAMLSASDPHHISSYTYSLKGGNIDLSQTTTLSYVFNEHNQPTTIYLKSQSGEERVQIRY